MKVAIHDSDKTRFPNYALMKLSAWHKEHGDSVEWYLPIDSYDRVYSSKVFNFTPEDPYLPPDTIRGGTGYGIFEDLPEEIDQMFPDYTMYPKVDYAIGYLTRGCVHKCPWCVVPKKEGGVRPYRRWQEVVRPGIRDVVFMDNNVLASQYGLEQIEEMTKQNLRVDFNQGLDARMITPEIATLLSKLKWLKQIRMAADTDAMLPVVLEKIELLKANGINTGRIFVFVLTKDIESAERRALAIKATGADPFAQPYRDFTTNIEPAKELKDFARWVNNRAIFNSTNSFAEYNTKIRGHNKEREART